MYGLAIDVTESWPQRTCGAQYTLYVMYKTCGLSIRTNRLPCEEIVVNYIADYVKKYISYGISGSRSRSVRYTYSHMVW